MIGTSHSLRLSATCTAMPASQSKAQQLPSILLIPYSSGYFFLPERIGCKPHYCQLSRLCFCPSPPEVLSVHFVIYPVLMREECITSLLTNSHHGPVRSACTSCSLFILKLMSAGKKKKSLNLSSVSL